MFLVTGMSRIFCRQVGVPLNRYRNSIRLSRFMDLYDQPEQRTILECAYAAGFGSYAQFYKVFLLVYGYGPRRYLRAAKTVAGQARDQTQRGHGSGRGAGGSRGGRDQP